MKEFLQNLKVGDKVALSSHYHGLSTDIVVRITKTMIITERKRYSKRDGYVVGDSGFFKTRIQEATPEFMDKFYRQNYTQLIKNYVSNNKLDKLPVEQLKEIYTKLKNYCNGIEG